MMAVCFQSLKANPIADDCFVGVCAAAGGLYAAYHRNMSRFYESQLQALKRQKATMEIEEYRKNAVKCVHSTNALKICLHELQG